MLIATLTPGRGTLGGAVATATPHGARFHARAVRTQPRTASQTQVHARAHALAFAWRTLSATQRAGWQTLASGAASGYNLFLACNYRLTMLGLPPISNAPAAPAAFPALTALAATPIYLANRVGQPLYCWQLDTTPALDGTFGAVARATAVLSPTKQSIQPSDLRIVAAASRLYSPCFVPITSWARIFGLGQGIGNVTFELTLIDPETGFAGPTLRATSQVDWQTSGVPALWYDTLQQEGATFAQIYETVFEQEGQPIAGP